MGYVLRPYLFCLTFLFFSLYTLTDSQNASVQYLIFSVDATTILTQGGHILEKKEIIFKSE